MILIFNNSDGKLVMSSSVLPSSHEGDEYVKVRVEDEDYDPNYTYSVVDSEAVKGDLIVVDTAAIARLDAEFQATQYQRDRKYPPIGDQLDDIYHNGIDAWKVTIKAVKDAHPKP